MGSNNKRSRSEKAIEQNDLFVVGRDAGKVEKTHFPCKNPMET